MRNRDVMNQKEAISMIAAVRARPLLWDSHCEDYRANDQRVAEWKEIMQLLGLPDVNTCKRRWKALRDTYVRERRILMTRSSTEVARRAPWKYMKDMQFLEQCYEPINDETGSLNSSSGVKAENASSEADDRSQDTLLNWQRFSDGVEGEDDEEDTANGSEIREEMGDGSEDHRATGVTATNNCATLSKHGDSTGSDGSWQMQPPSAKRKRLADRLETSVIDLLEAQKRVLEARHLPTSADEDDLFMLSLVPSLKRLTPERKSFAKIQFQQILYNMEFLVPKSTPPSAATRRLSETSAPLVKQSETPSQSQKASVEGSQSHENQNQNE